MYQLPLVQAHEDMMTVTVVKVPPVPLGNTIPSPNSRTWQHSKPSLMTFPGSGEGMLLKITVSPAEAGAVVAENNAPKSPPSNRERLIIGCLLLWSAI